MNEQLTTEQRILKERTQIMRDPRFIAMAGIMMIGKWEVRDNVPTAYTNGRDVVYGRKFIDSLDTKTLRFVILHEYYHIMFMHMSMWKHLWDEHPMLANLAADFVINGMLDNHAGDFIKVWPHAALDHQYDGLDTGEVYRRLKQQAQGGQGSGKGQGKHRSASGGEAQDFDQHGVDDGEGSGLDPLTEEEVKELKQQIDSAIRQGAQFAGKLGGKLDRSMEGMLEASVPWQEVLQDFVKTTCAGDDLATWRKPSRRWMARDMYMPTRYSESVKRITIGVDTSGSIGDAQLQRALSEIKGACDTVNPEIVDVIYWDYDVAAHEIYEGDQVDRLVESTKPKGGGGTRVGAMLDYMKAKDIRPDCIIVFTDGYVERDWGGDNWPAPILWCISVKGITAPFGKSLYVPVE
jgi:predicted metal-dependent peptidase